MGPTVSDEPPAPARSNRTIGLVGIGPTIGRERELELHVLIAEGRQAAGELEAPLERSKERVTILRRRVRRGRQAEEELLAGTCALVKQRVNDLGFPFDREDLEAAGLEGLVKALREFDPSRDVRFATYASYWISKMVMASISHRVPYPDADLRAVVRFRRLARQRSGRPLSTTEVAKSLAISRTEASRIMRMSSDIAAGMADIDDSGPAALAARSTSSAEAEWVIDILRDILGDDFEDFWLWTGGVMSLEELGRRNGVSKQAMAKRVKKWRHLVETSPDADLMVTWLRAQ
jgi:biotin operon repressor